MINIARHCKAMFYEKNSSSIQKTIASSKFYSVSVRLHTLANHLAIKNFISNKNNFALTFFYTIMMMLLWKKLLEPFFVIIIKYLRSLEFAFY